MKRFGPHFSTGLQNWQKKTHRLPHQQSCQLIQEAFLCLDLSFCTTALQVVQVEFVIHSRCSLWYLESRMEQLIRRHHTFFPLYTSNVSLKEGRELKTPMSQSYMQPGQSQHLDTRSQKVLQDVLVIWCTYAVTVPNTQTSCQYLNSQIPKQKLFFKNYMTPHPLYIQT